jgi:hypothetical protein
LAGADDGAACVAPLPSGFFSGQPVREAKSIATSDPRRSALMGRRIAWSARNAQAAKAYDLLQLPSMPDPYDPTSSNNHRIGRDALPSSLDQDRTASMADEGGVSGALMELDDSGERRRLIARQRTSMGFAPWRAAAAAFVLVGVGAIAWGWLKRTL